MTSVLVLLLFFVVIGLAGERLGNRGTFALAALAVVLYMLYAYASS